MALAIAQGVAAGADLGDGKGKTMTVDRTKTTMPQAVTALVEEALVCWIDAICLLFSCSCACHLTVRFVYYYVERTLPS